MSDFDHMASSWWDPHGPVKTLHHINPLRVDWIQSWLSLKDKNILDVGCGGGLLSESLAQSGAHVTAIDSSAELIEIAKLHSATSQLSIDYQHIPLSHLSKEESFDAIICLEVLEHVDQPDVFLSDCVRLLKPGGYLFLSTINRTAKSYLLMIIMAEYILKLIPLNTHHWEKFIRPSELQAWVDQSHLLLKEIKGVFYNPLTCKAHFVQSVDVNYFMVCQK